MPEFRFRYDPSLAQGQQTLDLLRTLEGSRESGNEGSRDANESDDDDDEASR
jgi:hypothetical protein